MGRTGCCEGYTTRSYNFDGSTNWVRNYYHGLRGMPPTDRIAVAVDDDNNVYTCGKCVEVGSETWSAIKYDVDGNVLWKFDARQYLRDQVGSDTNYKLDMYDVTVLSDGSIFMVGDDFFNSTRGWLAWHLQADGTPLGTVVSANNGTGIGMNVNVTSDSAIPIPSYRVITEDRSAYPVLLLPYTGRMAPGFNGARVAYGKGLTDRIIIETANSSEPSAFGYALAWFRPTIADTPIYLPSGEGPLDDWWNWAFYAAKPPVLVTDVFQLFVDSMCTSFDGSKLFVSVIQGGVGISTNFVSVVTDPTDYTQSAGVGFTSHLGTGEDNVHWHVDRRAVAMAPIDGGVVCSGGSPTLRAYDEDDGSDLWGVHHNSVFDMDSSANRLVTTGLYQTRRGESP